MPMSQIHETFYVSHIFRITYAANYHSPLKPAG